MVQKVVQREVERWKYLTAPKKKKICWNRFLSYMQNGLMTCRVVKPPFLPDSYLHFTSLLISKLGLAVVLLPYFQILNNFFLTEACYLIPSLNRLCWSPAFPESLVWAGQRMNWAHLVAALWDLRTHSGPGAAGALVLRRELGPREQKWVSSFPKVREPCSSPLTAMSSKLQGWADLRTIDVRNIQTYR